jgi:hypothetical protein
MSYGVGATAFYFVADGVQKVRFTQAGITVYEKRIIGIPRGLADRNAACVSEAIAGAYDEIFKRVIGMQHRHVSPDLPLRRKTRKVRRGKLDRYQVACNLLCRFGESAPAVILEKMSAGVVRAADLKQSPRHVKDAKIVKPHSRIDRVKRLCAVKNLSKNIFNLSARQIILLEGN